MRAYGDLVVSATKSVDDFARDDVIDDASRSWLCAEYPDELGLTFIDRKAGRLTVIAKSPEAALARISADLCCIRGSRDSTANTNCNSPAARA